MMRRIDCKKPIFCLAAVWIMLLLDVSTATWSPHQPPKRLLSHHVVEVSQQYIINGDTPRGGSTKLQSPPPLPPPPLSQEIEDYDNLLDHSPEQGKDQDQRATFISPKIHLKHVAEALLHTSEWNRRLRQGLKYWGTRLKQSPSSQSHRRNIEYHHQQELHSSYNYDNDAHNNYYSHHHQQQERNMHFGKIPVNGHSSPWQPPIQASSDRLLEEELSLFHAQIPEPRSSSSQSSSEIDNEIEKLKHGDGYNKDEESEEEVTKHELDDDDDDIRYWGPELLPYLEYICDRLGIDKDGVELSLAMIYMDRACSVETSRSNNIQSCPFCTPRTVHRLSLAALIISLEAVCGGEQQQRLQLLSVSLGIPLLQLQQMVEWMRAALGYGGLLVTMKELIAWNHSLDAIFSLSPN